MPPHRPNLTRQAVVGVGANLGDRWGTMNAALQALEKTPGILYLERSAVFETAPVGVTAQPVFLNLVAGIETTLPPEELLAVLLRLERAAGRERKLETRWGPRTLDLDLLLFEGELRAGPELELPHPRMGERDFVLAPLQDLLEHSPRFQKAAGQEWRARLAKYVPPKAGIARWTPPE